MIFSLDFSKGVTLPLKHRRWAAFALFCWAHVLTVLGVAAALAAPSIALGQSAEFAINPKTLLVTPIQNSGNRWNSLSALQQQTLKPLAGLWETMDAAQQRKWLALVQTFPNLSPAEQEKLKSRMVEWAALSPKDRTAARLNFALTKSVDKAERAANWEAYQALPEDEKKRLAAKAPAKPVGAAVTVKPVPPQKLAVVPVTRNTPQQERDAAVSQSPLNRYTLLPEPAPAPTLPPLEGEAVKP